MLTKMEQPVTSVHTLIPYIIIKQIYVNDAIHTRTIELSATPTKQRRIEMRRQTAIHDGSDNDKNRLHILTR